MALSFFLLKAIAFEEDQIKNVGEILEINCPK